jgi:aminopeptidase
VPDSRLDTLASVLCRYSLDVKPGDIVRISGPALAHGLFAAMAAEIGRLGAHPMMRATLPAVEVALLEHATDEQLTAVTPLDELEIDVPAKILSIWADSNTRYLSGVSPDRQALSMKARRQLTDRFFDRLATGDARWCGVSLPTEAHAQDAGMSLADYERFVYGAGHLDDPDPIAFWHEQSARQAAVIERLAGVSELRIVAEDTDLTVDVEGRRWMNADGRENFPDGEIYTSPRHEHTRGHISFSFDATYHGQEFAGVKLWFEDGRVVRHAATRGEEFLSQMLDMDDGARYLGEVAFGMNDEIQQPVKNVAFDEKIGGTCHVALGAAFPEAGGTNRSSLHWDIVRDLRSGGEVYADGELVAKDGRFL